MRHGAGNNKGGKRDQRESKSRLQLVSCKLDTAHKTVTFQFAPHSDKPAVIAEKLVSEPWNTVFNFLESFIVDYFLPRNIFIGEQHIGREESLTKFQSIKNRSWHREK